MNTPTILFDHQAFEMQRFGGVSNYFSQLMRCLPVPYELSLGISSNAYLHDIRYDKSLHLPHRLFQIFKGELKKINLRNSKIRLAQKKYTLFHPTYYNPYFLNYIEDTPYVLTVHDMNHELMPHYFNDATRMAQWKKQTVEKASHIIAVSNNTKKDLTNLLDVNPDKVTVVYHGIDLGTTSCQHLQLPERYILYVGDRNGYKNFQFLLNVFHSIHQKETDLHLVCAGKDFSQEEKNKLKKYGLHSYVHARQVGESGLNQLYQKACLFVYPSLYEGFGIPILEAFKNHCPIALSHASCFPEIARDAAVYFNPLNAEEAEEVIHRMLLDESQRRLLIERGEKLVQTFNWQNTAQKTLAVYNNVQR